MDIKELAAQIVERHRSHVSSQGQFIEQIPQKAESTRASAVALHKDSSEIQTLLEQLDALIGNDQVITEAERQALSEGVVLPSLKDGQSMKAEKLAALSLKGHGHTESKYRINGSVVANTLIAHYKLGEEELEVETEQLCEFIRQHLVQDSSGLYEAVSGQLGKGGFYDNLDKLRTTLLRTCVEALVNGYKHALEPSDKAAADNRQYSALNTILSDGYVMKSVIDKIVNLQGLVDTASALPLSNRV